MSAAGTMARRQRLAFSTAGFLGVPPGTLERLGRIAHGMGADITVVDCVYDQQARAANEMADLSAHIQARVEQRRREVQCWADVLRARGLSVHTVVEWDQPAHEAIVRYVMRHPPDLLVVPAVRSSAAEQQRLSCIDRHLIATCPSPLLLLKIQDSRKQGAVLAAIDPDAVHAQGSQLNEGILSAAKAIASSLGDVPVHVCHTVSPGRAGSEPLASARERVRALAACYGITSDRVHVEPGFVETAIARQIRSVCADVLVMGASSHALTRRANIIPRAEKMLNALACDVLIVKPEDFSAPVSRRRPRATCSPRSKQTADVRGDAKNLGQ